ncbi:MAG TPA: hypothetical protein VFU40_12275 [Gemmatimonadales bacterium]|nr:hypothetical protein [Gemmatimonadales bacterium]
MIGLLTSPYRRASLRVIAAGFLFSAVAACGSDGLGPLAGGALPADSALVPAHDTTVAPPSDSTSPAPTDSSLTPTDSSDINTATAAQDTRSSLPGIVFATMGMDNSYFNDVHTGSLRAGGAPDDAISLLADARARGARIALKLTRGSEEYVKNSDGTFNFTKWKDLVNRFRTVNLDPYIADGTLLGHFLIDEPHMAAKWGGKIIPQSTVEAMAQYSKQIWPEMNTFVHTQMSWLAGTPLTYRYLDAGWTQYAANKGGIATWASTEISNAKTKGLGLLMGLNVLNGGNGSSGIRGTRSGKYAMSASELRNYGTAILNQSYACAFVMWEHKTTYYDRTDMKGAMAALSVLAKGHVKTACRQ